MSKFTVKLGAVLLTSAMTLSPAIAQQSIASSAVSEEQSAFERDRADILAMAGNYKVRFDMQESTPWTADYEPRERKISGGNEVVRVIEDSGNKIMLQHLLVVEHGGKNMIIKHWRQDWEYEPENMLVYSDRHRWELQPVSRENAKGKWSQTVYQVDDSPRYAGLGTWETEAGTRRWSSDWTWRPLARRDAVRNPVYDRYYAINRHSPTPDGWIHFQDNIKMGMVDGELKPIVSEYVLNTYTKFDDYNVQSADDYWQDTATYWQAVRATWDMVAARKNGIPVEEEAQTGTIISGKLLTMADQIRKNEMTEAAAIAEAKKLIVQATNAPTPAQTAAGKAEESGY